MAILSVFIAFLCPALSNCSSYSLSLSLFSSEFVLLFTINCNYANCAPFTTANVNVPNNCGCIGYLSSFLANNLKTTQLELNTDLHTSRAIARLKEPLNLFALPKDKDHECSQQTARWPAECQVNLEQLSEQFKKMRAINRIRHHVKLIALVTSTSIRSLIYECDDAHNQTH